MKTGMLESSVFHFCPKKRSMTEITMVKTDGQSKLITIGKMQSQHFTMNKLHLSKGSVVKLDQTKIAIFEVAIDKFHVFKVGV
jgi:hypothetical protein